MLSRLILHVDMDAFYASVEQRDEPSLRGRPVLVGGTGGRGVVAAASYEARRYGVHSAMPMREALRRCPDAACVPPRMSLYQDVSRQIFDIFHGHTPLVQGLSLDEAFLDLTGSSEARAGGAAAGMTIKREIRARTGLTASVGVAPNKLVAKIASDLRKPDGLLVVREEEIHSVLDPLPIRKLFGLGAKTAPRLEAIGIRSLGELRRASAQRLRPILGRHAEQLLQRAAGIDDRPVIPDRDEKQISAEETFDRDIADPVRLRSEILRLADRTSRRLRTRALNAGCVTVKIRRADFVTFTRQRRFEPAASDTRVITALAAGLLDEWLRGNPGTALRLLGVGVSELTHDHQPDLFEAPGTARDRRLDATRDSIRDRFGSGALAPASTLARRGRTRERSS